MSQDIKTAKENYFCPDATIYMYLSTAEDFDTDL